MRSRHARRFDHDDEAEGYDEDVRREEHPIRAGYAATLDWVAESARGERRIVDLGAGTGNLTLRLPAGARVTCVDVSARMLERARAKLAGRDVEYVREDLLATGALPEGRLDALVSTYACHHLEDDEKELLLAAALRALRPGGLLAVGDLAFADLPARERFLGARPELRADVEDEFFWRLDLAVEWLAARGLAPETQRFSELSWGLRVRASS